MQELIRFPQYSLSLEFSKPESSHTPGGIGWQQRGRCQLCRLQSRPSQTTAQFNTECRNHRSKTRSRPVITKLRVISDYYTEANQAVLSVALPAVSN